MKKLNKLNTVKRSISAVLVTVMVILAVACDTTGNDSALKENMDPASKTISDGPSLEDENIHKVVDVQPEPQAGLHDFLTYMANNINYPEKAREAGIQGKVYVEFVVDHNGDIKNVKTIKGLGHGLDKEAERVIAGYDKKWSPGIKDGKKVNTRMVLPVNFAL